MGRSEDNAKTLYTQKYKLLKNCWRVSHNTAWPLHFQFASYPYMYLSFEVTPEVTLVWVKPSQTLWWPLVQLFMKWLATRHCYSILLVPFGVGLSGVLTQTTGNMYIACAINPCYITIQVSCGVHGVCVFVCVCGGRGGGDFRCQHQHNHCSCECLAHHQEFV